MISYAVTPCLVLVMSVLPLITISGAERSLNVARLQSVRFEQRLQQRLSLNLNFRDENGASVTLAQYFHGKPALIVPGYYGCPMLCGQVANGLIEGLQDITATPGRDFELVFLSIDAKETPDLAAQKKRTYLKRYGRASSAAGWHFLTGSKGEIESVSMEIGLHYAYDPASKQYAHPSGLVVVRPDGTIAQYIFGVTYSPRDLSAALKNAAKGEVQAPIKELLLLCFHYTPLTGKYAGLVVGLVRAAALATLFVLVGLLFVMTRRSRRKVA